MIPYFRVIDCALQVLLYDFSFNLFNILNYFCWIFLFSCTFWIICCNFYHFFPHLFLHILHLVNIFCCIFLLAYCTFWIICYTFYFLLHILKNLMHLFWNFCFIFISTSHYVWCESIEGSNTNQYQEQWN